MLNELEEFRAYTSPVEYVCKSKSDTTFLGRFTMERLLDFYGMGRIFTILARGYMFQSDPPDLDRARRALCAWCSMPENKSPTPRKEWEDRIDFWELHEEFPELVDADGQGWFYRHAHNVAEFVLKNADAVRKGFADTAEAIQQKFDTEWSGSVKRFQIPIFHLDTKGAWTLRFDDVIADALLLGPLKNYEVTIPEDHRQRIEKIMGKKAAPYVCDLIAYYHAHKEADCDWVLLPVTSFDMYYGGSYFSKRILSTIPEEILVRKNNTGTCLFSVSENFRL